ncbi:MAG: hypothetical protein EPO32_14905 [Anaerolineae bacterium]|nr:MAG: hypothetical protein EPO32_14905 [Anaerolineae bacterium]
MGDPRANPFQPGLGQSGPDSLSHAQEEQLAKQKADYLASGYSVGFSQGDKEQTARSKVVGEETAGQRYINRQTSYAYGGSPDQAAKDVERARAVAATGAAPISALGTSAQATGQALQNRAGPGVNFADAAAMRARQQQVFDATMAAGQAQPGPSAAQAQLQMGTNQALANQLALARSGRGAGDAASAMRQAAFQNADIQQNASNSAAMLRAQEDEAFRQRQLAAFGAAGQLAGGIRQQDVDSSKFITDTELRNRQLNDAAGLGYGQLALGGYTSAAGANMEGERLGATINTNALAGTMGYEDNLQSYYLHKAAPKNNSLVPIAGAAVGAVGGYFVGGPAGAAGGAKLGYDIGERYSG